MDAKQLRSESQSKRDQAQRCVQDAAKYNAAGNFDRAKSIQDQVQRLNTEAAQLEQRAMELEKQANDQEQRAREIEQKQAELQTQINKLEQDKQAHLGGSSPTTPLI